MNSHIDADIAHALVNYVDRKTYDLRDWGEITATDVRKYIYLNTTLTNTVDIKWLRGYLTANETSKMYAGANGKAAQFRELIKRVKKFDE